MKKRKKDGLAGDMAKKRGKSLRVEVLYDFAYSHLGVCGLKFKGETIEEHKAEVLTKLRKYKLLKKDQHELQLKMIFITGDTMNVKVQSFLQESGIPYLTKPFTPKDLVKKVKANLT